MTTSVGPVPPRADWPEPAPQTEAGRLVTEIVLATFRLNARILEAGQELATAGGITVTWWQVLGGVLDEPRTVADVARQMGMTRQGVLRVADLLVERGLAEYRTNPAHRRAKLLACTEAGYWAVRQISVEQHPWAARVGDALGVEMLTAGLAGLHRLVQVLEAEAGQEKSAL